MAGYVYKNTGRRREVVEYGGFRFVNGTPAVLPFRFNSGQERDLGWSGVEYVGPATEVAPPAAPVREALPEPEVQNDPAPPAPAATRRYRRGLGRS